MKRIVLTVTCGLVLSIAAFSSNRQSTVEVEIRLTDSQTGKVIPGLIQVINPDGQTIPLRMSSEVQPSASALMPRGLGLKDQPGIDNWSVMTGPTRLQLPRQLLRLKAFSGLETETTERRVDLTSENPKAVELALRRFYHPADRHWHSANTHVHLMKLERDIADRYLQEIPRADGLDLVFVSHLERAEADRDYISNRYSRNDLTQLQTLSGTLFGNGEEHRHNFMAQGEGYGHVMLLDLRQLIQPVSIGPGITKTGTDGLPLQRGIDQAHREDATVIWCHNTLGLERIANQVTGRLDAQNIFDGSDHPNYEAGFYRSLNAGLNVPFSTGTDWFIYDFSRTFARVEETFTTGNWLKALKSGRSYITNGPFLEFHVEGREPGDRVDLAAPASVNIEARAIGRVDFQRIEIVQNGRVIRSEISRSESGHFVAEIAFDLMVNSPCWLAIRTPPVDVDTLAGNSQQVALNEYGKPIYAHTSALYIDIARQRHFDRIVANELLTEMQRNLETVNRKGAFANELEIARVNDVYREAIAELERRIRLELNE